MRTIRDAKVSEESYTWEEKSGLIKFLSDVPAVIDTFNKDFGFGINNRAGTPAEIDGDAGLPLKTGFIVTRDNPLMPEFTYCLYSLLIGRELYGYVGIYSDRNVKTIKQLRPVKDFKKGKVILFEWLKQLVRASCEKIMI